MGCLPGCSLPGSGRLPRPPLPHRRSVFRHNGRAPLRTAVVGAAATSLSLSLHHFATASSEALTVRDRPFPQARGGNAAQEHYCSLDFAFQ
eukprot:832443-Prorocentrum_minimum.AAC.2